MLGPAAVSLGGWLVIIGVAIILFLLLVVSVVIAGSRADEELDRFKDDFRARDEFIEDTDPPSYMP